ncbi:MAG: hypothetical protein HOV68_06730, partial [Streptomycetaceae bacterium]|nr:hypothetical protein [Streptomycetaceae bacterium]
LAFGAVAAWQVEARARAADRLVSHSGPLSQDAAEIYRSLADADTTAAGGFLLAGDEPASVRERYDKDLATAAELLSRAAARTSASSAGQQWIAAINRQLPQYAGLVDRARTYNRQGYPLGGAYLRYASTLMQDTILPDAQRLVDAETRRLDADYDQAEAFPWAAAALAAAGLAALAWYQLVLFRRTNRVFNIGLAGATVALLGSALWLVVGATGAASSLADSRTHGAEPLRSLYQARIDAAKAHTAENLNLVARGSSTVYATRWDAEQLDLTGKPDGPAGSLTQAQEDASGIAAERLAEARAQLVQWQERHKNAADLDEGGNYDGALRATITAVDGPTADAAFTAMDRAFDEAAAAEKRAFADAARDVDGDLRMLALGVGVLAVPAAVAVVWGIGRRLADYRF